MSVPRYSHAETRAMLHTHEGARTLIRLSGPRPGDATPHPERDALDMPPWGNDQCAGCPASAAVLYVATTWRRRPLPRPGMAELPGVSELYLCRHHASVFERVEWGAARPDGELSRWVLVWDVRPEIEARERALRQRVDFRH